MKGEICSALVCDYDFFRMMYQAQAELIDALGAEADARFVSGSKVEIEYQHNKNKTKTVTYTFE